MSKKLLAVLICLADFAIASSLPVREAPSDRQRLRTWALAIPVEDVETAKKFYRDGLDFSILDPESHDRSTSGRPAARPWVLLTLGEARIIVYQTSEEIEAAAWIYPNFQVSELGSAGRRVGGAGGGIDSAPRSIAIGQSLSSSDPSGNRFNLITIEGRTLPADIPIAFFNLSIRAPSIDMVEPFLAKLDYEVWTRDYLPQTLVYARKDGFSVVVHPHGDGSALPNLPSRRSALVLAAADLEAVHARLEQEGLSVSKTEAPWGNSEPTLRIKGPAGLIVYVISRPVP